MDYLFFYLFFLFIIWTFIVKSIHDAPEMEDIKEDLYNRMSSFHYFYLLFSFEEGAM